MEGERSCYRGGQFKGGNLFCYTSGLFNGGGLVTLERWQV